MDKIALLKELLASGKFHHATTRHHGGRLMWGLHIYQKEDNGFNGFSHALFFPENDPETERAAYELVRKTGVSFGAYGQG
jgi:hypothetical protein